MSHGQGGIIRINARCARNCGPVDSISCSQQRMTVLPDFRARPYDDELLSHSLPAGSAKDLFVRLKVKESEGAAALTLFGVACKSFCVSDASSTGLNAST